MSLLRELYFETISFGAEPDRLQRGCWCVSEVRWLICQVRELVVQQESMHHQVRAESHLDARGHRHHVARVVICHDVAGPGKLARLILVA